MNSDSKDHIDRMPPAELLESLPEKEIPPPEPITKPLPLLERNAVNYAVESGNLGIAAQLVSEDTTDPARFIRTLIDLGETSSALGFLAWALPKRVGLWWAFECCWTTMLDRDRHLARASLPAADEGAGKSPSPEPASDSEEKAFLSNLRKASDEIGQEQGEALAKIEALEADFDAALQKMLEAMPDHTIIRSPLAEMIHHEQVIDAKLAALRVEENTASLPPKPVNMTFPRPANIKPRPSAPKLDDPLAPIRARIDRRRVESEIRGLAVCLQWVLNPAQQHAKEAAEALAKIHESPSASALAKATFWCGDNMNTLPNKPQVPPPPGLPRKGISTSITKSLGIKNTGWSRIDKINWYLRRGIMAAEGLDPWSEADERFDRYMRWALEKKTHPGASS